MLRWRLSRPGRRTTVPALLRETRRLGAEQAALDRERRRLGMQITAAATLLPT